MLMDAVTTNKCDTCDFYKDGKCVSTDKDNEKCTEFSDQCDNYIVDDKLVNF